MGDVRSRRPRPAGYKAGAIARRLIISPSLFRSILPDCVDMGSKGGNKNNTNTRLTSTPGGEDKNKVRAETHR